MVGAHAAAPHSVGRGDRRFVRRAVLLRPRARVRAHRAQAARRLVQKRAVRALPLRGRRASPAVVPRRPGSPGGRRRLRHGRGLGGGVSAWGAGRTRARETNARERDERACPRAPARPSRVRRAPRFSLAPPNPGSTRPPLPPRRALAALCPNPWEKRPATAQLCRAADAERHPATARIPPALCRVIFAAAGEIFVRRGADRDFSSRFEESNPRTWLENRGKSVSNPAKTRANSLDSTSKRREGAEARKSAGKVSRKYLEVVFFFV